MNQELYNKKYVPAPMAGSRCVACNKELDVERQPNRGIISNKQLCCCRVCSTIINYSVADYVDPREAIGLDIMDQVDGLVPYVEEGGDENHTEDY